MFAKRVALFAIVIVLGDCAFAQKHPGVTVGITTGAIGFGACELSVERVGTCAAIGGVAGLVLGGITGLVTLFADTSAHDLSNLDEEEQERVPAGTPPPPGLPPGMTGLDAGVGAAVDARLPGPGSGVGMDAGVRQPDAAL